MAQCDPSPWPHRPDLGSWKVAHLLLLEDDESSEEELLLELLLVLLLPLASSLCAARSSATVAKSGRFSLSAASSLTDIFGRPFFVRRHACRVKYVLALR